jgi:hypothetical protein
MPACYGNTYPTYCYNHKHETQNICAIMCSICRKGYVEHQLLYGMCYTCCRLHNRSVCVTHLASILNSSGLNVLTNVAVKTKTSVQPIDILICYMFYDIVIEVNRPDHNNIADIFEALNTLNVVFIKINTDSSLYKYAGPTYKYMQDIYDCRVIKRLSDEETLVKLVHELIIKGIPKPGISVIEILDGKISIIG